MLFSVFCVGFVFSDFLIFVDLLVVVVVVIVIVQRLYCCYCSDHQNDPQLSTKTRFFCNFAGFKMLLSDFETIPSDFERFSHQTQRKFKGSQPQPA